MKPAPGSRNECFEEDFRRGATIHRGLQEELPRPEGLAPIEDAIRDAVAGLRWPTALVVCSTGYYDEIDRSQCGTKVVCFGPSRPVDFSDDDTFVRSLVPGRYACALRFFAGMCGGYDAILISDGDKCVGRTRLLQFATAPPKATGCSNGLTVFNAGSWISVPGCVTRGMYHDLLAHGAEYGSDEIIPTYHDWDFVCIVDRQDVRVQGGYAAVIGDRTLRLDGADVAWVRGTYQEFFVTVERHRQGYPADFEHQTFYDTGPAERHFTSTTDFCEALEHFYPTGIDILVTGRGLTAGFLVLTEGDQEGWTVDERYHIVSWDQEIPFRDSAGVRLPIHPGLTCDGTEIGLATAVEHTGARRTTTLCPVGEAVTRLSRVSTALGVMSLHAYLPRPSRRQSPRFPVTKDGLGSRWRPFETSWGARDIVRNEIIQGVHPDAMSLSPAITLPDVGRVRAAIYSTPEDSHIGVCSVVNFADVVKIKEAAEHIRSWIWFSECARPVELTGPDVWVEYPHFRCSPFIFQGIRLLVFVWGHPSSIYSIVNDAETVSPPLAFRTSVALRYLPEYRIVCPGIGDYNACPFQDTTGYGDSLASREGFIMEALARIGWIYGADEYILQHCGALSVPIGLGGGTWVAERNPPCQVIRQDRLLTITDGRVVRRQRPVIKVSRRPPVMTIPVKHWLSGAYAGYTHQYLVFFSFGTYGDTMPLQYGARIAVARGVPVLAVNLLDRAEAVEALARAEAGEAWRDIPAMLQAFGIVASCPYPNICPIYLWGSHRSATFDLSPSTKCVKNPGLGMPMIIDWCMRYLTPRGSADHRIGAYKGWLPRSADGFTPLPSRPLVNPARHGEITFAGSSRAVTGGVRGDHLALAREAEVVVCAGGAGAVQTAAMGGARVVVIDSQSLDRKYRDPDNAGKYVTGCSSGILWLRIARRSTYCRWMYYHPYYAIRLASLPSLVETMRVATFIAVVWARSRIDVDPLYNAMRPTLVGTCAYTLLNWWLDETGRTPLSLATTFLAMFWLSVTHPLVNFAKYFGGNTGYIVALIIVYAADVASGLASAGSTVSFCAAGRPLPLAPVLVCELIDGPIPFVHSYLADRTRAVKINLQQEGGFMGTTWNEDGSYVTGHKAMIIRLKAPFNESNISGRYAAWNNCHTRSAAALWGTGIIVGIVPLLLVTPLAIYGVIGVGVYTLIQAGTMVRLWPQIVA